MNLRYRLIQPVENKVNPALLSSFAMRSFRSMRFGQFIVVPAVLLALAVPAAAATHTRRGPTAPSKAFGKRAAKPKVQSQRTIDDERATQIQAALIKLGLGPSTASPNSLVSQPAPVAANQPRPLAQP